MDVKQLRLERLRRSLKGDFWAFLIYMDGDPWKLREPYLKPVADEITRYWTAEDCELDKYKEHEEGQEDYYFMFRVQISAFPRFMKSFFSQRLKEWLLLRDDELQIMSLSATQSLSKRLHQKMMATFEANNRFKLLFNGTSYISNSNEFSINKEKINVIATSISGQSTGSGANVIIVDDAYKDHKEALSPTRNETVIDFYHSAIKNRFEGKKRMEIHIGTRWTTKELTATLLNRNHFDMVVKVQALKDNKSVLPSVISTNELLQFMHDDAITFDSTYQQNPNDVKGALFKHDDFVTNHMFVKDEKSISFMSIDLADSGSDRTSAPFVARNKITGNYTVAAIFVSDEDGGGYEEKLKDYIIKHRPTFVQIEKNSDPTMARILKATCDAHGIIGIIKHTTSNKHQKILSNAGRIRSLELLSSHDGYYGDALNELFSYEKDGSSKHDDVADSMAMTIELMVQYLPNEFNVYGNGQEEDNAK